MPVPLSSATSPAVSCRGLVVRYKDHTAVDGVDFDASAGEVVALLGPNGAGKTSTVEAVEGYRTPAAGEVRVLGLDPIAERARLVPHLGVMLQRGGTYPVMGPERALRLFAAYYRDPADPGALLDLLGLRPVARTPYRQLSGGEQQRLALALALVGQPEVAVLDEPTAGVDPEGRQVVRRVVTSLAAKGACVIVTTHDLSEAELWADRVLVLQDGSIAAEGPPDALVRRGRLAGTTPAGQVRFSTAAPLDVAALETVVGAPVTEEGRCRYRVVAPSSPEVVAAVTTWLAEQRVPLTNLHSGTSLEEAYLDIVGSPGGEVDTTPAAERGAGGEGAGRRRRRSSRMRRPG